MLFQSAARKAQARMVTSEQAGQSLDGYATNQTCAQRKKSIVKRRAAPHIPKCTAEHRKKRVLSSLEGK
jgi:hypothetical protein